MVTNTADKLVCGAPQSG